MPAGMTKRVATKSSHPTAHRLIINSAIYHLSKTGRPQKSVFLILELSTDLSSAKMKFFISSYDLTSSLRRFGVTLRVLSCRNRYPRRRTNGSVYIKLLERYALRCKLINIGSLCVCVSKT
jgi:hypothetical protein